MIVFMPVYKEQQEKPDLPLYEGLKMKRDEFALWQPEQIEKEVKYEWNRGALEARPKMKLTETILFRNLNRAFVQTTAFQKGASLAPEVNIFLPEFECIRRPDICYFSPPAMKKIADGENVIPEWIIEIISRNNTFYEVEEKLHQYFVSATKLVWLIHPENREVKVYQSLKQIQLCNEQDYCSAPGVLHDFQISIQQLFA